MENPTCPRAVDLVFDYLLQKLPTHLIEFLPSGANDFSIQIDGVGVGELNNTKLFLLDPEIDLCIIIDLAHPESLEWLLRCVVNHTTSKHWRQTMITNRIKRVHDPINSVFRSSLGYKKIWI